jgi:hypothetical protein
MRVSSYRIFKKECIRPEGGDYANNITDCGGFAALGSVAHLALQCKLGLLSKRRIGFGAADCRGPGTHRPFVEEIAAPLWLRRK